MRLHEEVALTRTGLTIWAYSGRGKYLGRVEINRAGLAAYTGRKGKKLLGNMRWERSIPTSGPEEAAAHRTSGLKA